MDSLELVREFHKVFNHAIGECPQLPLEKDHIFRLGFMKEEMKEADKAYMSYFDSDDKGLKTALIEYADALGDIQYVLDGWFLNAGLQGKKQAIIEEIHRSNMTKACKTVEEAERTIDKLVSEDAEKYSKGEKDFAYGLAYEYEEIDNYFIVKRSSDGKVMKGINYEPPNLEKIIYGTK